MVNSGDGKIKEFFEKFFGNLGCKLVSEEDCLVISDVPASFEKFSGKKSPYYLCFGQNPVSEIYEKINSNHYLVKSMKEFLEGHGETTLLKLEVQFEPKEEIPNLIPFRNCKIKSVSKTSRNDFVLRFSFGTVFQYLNDKEQIINNIYIRNGDVIDFDGDLSFTEGNKRDLKEINTQNEYELAKTKLRELINPKLEELSSRLNEKLKKEISRIESHYKNNLDEIKQQREMLIKQVEECDDSTDGIDKKKKFEKMLEKIKDENSENKLSQEEKTLIDHEIRKHGLSVKNKLINVSVIYFPIYNVSFVVNAGNDKMLNVEYDSLKKKINPLFCASCKCELDEIIVCSSGHLTCRNCGSKCEFCEGISCKSCAELKCSFCGRRLCSACADTCSFCKNVFCKDHLNSVPGSNKKLCRNCTQRCSKCSVIVEPNSMRKIDGRIFCMKCYNKEVGKKILEGVFE